MLKKSCCCYSLEYGAVVIGITFFIINAVGFLMQVNKFIKIKDTKLIFGIERALNISTILLINSLLNVLSFNLTIGGNW